MAAIMNPITSNQLLRVDKSDRLRGVMNHIKAPRIENPTENELNALVNYWASISKHIESIELIQKYGPDYMPPFEVLEIIDGDLRITALTVA